MSTRQSRSRQRAHVVTAVVLVTIIVAACSSNHGSAAPSSSAASSGSSTTAAPPAAKFGTLASPCGTGNATGATDKGVTDTSITIGYGDDAGYAAAPGLDKEMSDGMRAIIGWCNAQGGVNGRKIVGNYYDARTLQVVQAMTQACNDKIFMLVGQGWVLDDGQETTRISCKLSSVPGFAVSSAFASGSGVASPLPSVGTELTASSAFQIAKLFPDAIKKAAFIYAQFPATQETRDKAAAAYPKAGWKFLKCDQIYNVAGESDWKPIASNLKACGVQAAVWVGSPDPNMENLLNAARQVGYTPKAWVTDPNGYTSAFAKWNAENGGAGNNVYVRMTGVPLELANQVPAVQQYADLVNKQHGLVGLLGEESTSAFLLWATAVKSCGSQVTAKCVLDDIGTIHSWDGGGMQVTTDPGANAPGDCGMLIKLDGGKWVKVTPSGSKLFDCNPEYLVTGINTSAVQAAKLNSSGIATEYGTYTP
jgi:ABC-type branched-subunit amino acid transport system substrate-binding protein